MAGHYTDRLCTCTVRALHVQYQLHVQNSLREGIWPARSVTALEGRDALWLTGWGWGEGNTVKISFIFSPREG